MRLQRLNLTRYGIFTDHVIDFGSCEAGQPDFHIIYGLNEAGKSTTFAAYLDLLFGIETRSQYNFLHPYTTMQVGAVLEIAEQAHDLVRIKKQHNDLLDASGQPLDRRFLAAALSGLDRDAYKTMLSLDDDTLEAGGESILASKGDIGQLLFSASTGLATFSRTLTGLQEQVDGFYKARGRNTELGRLKAKLDELQAEKKQLDTQASTYAQLVQARDVAKHGYDEAMELRARSKARMDEIKRLLDGLPLLASFRKLEEELSVLAELPEPPGDWADDIAGLLDNETKLQTRLDGADGEIKRLDNELHDIVVDGRVIAIADRIDRLNETEARYRTADDIPNRQLELNGVSTEIAGILRRLEQKPDADPIAFVLPASIVGTFQDLIETWSGIETRLQSAVKEHATAQQKLKQARDAIRKVGGEDKDGFDHAALSRTIAVIQLEDHGTRKHLAEIEKAKLEDQFNRHMDELRPWQGNAAALAQVIVPVSAQLEDWKRSIQEVEKRLDVQASEIERLTTECESREAEIEAIRKSAHVVGDDEAGVARARRDDAWSAHRTALDEYTARSFEEALQHDDQITDARLGNASGVAQLRDSSRMATIKRVEIERATKLRDATDERLQNIHQEIADAIRKMAVPGTEPLPMDTPLAQFENWLERRARALDVLVGIRGFDLDIQRAKNDREAARARLLDALSTAGIDHDNNARLEALLSAAVRITEQEKERCNKLLKLQEDMDACEVQLTARNDDLKGAGSAAEAWKKAWNETITHCWLRGSGKIATTAEVRQILKEVAALEPASEKRTGLVDRIAKMQADRHAFIEEVRFLATELDEEFTPTDPLHTATRLRARVEEARQNRKIRTAKMQELEHARARRHLVADDLVSHDARKSQMSALFGVRSLAEVNEKLAQVAQRAVLVKRRSDLEQQIIGALRRSSFEQAQAALTNIERDVLATEAADLEGRYADLDERTRNLFADYSKALDAIDAVGGDAAPARLEEQRQTILLDIEEKALHCLRLKLGIAAAERALRAYREKHRNSMMIEASNAFQTISRGAYSSLATLPDKDTEVLIGLMAAGGSKIAAEMSKGTRFQLYLALRVAGYYEFARSRQSLPFIADDILETFDDFRAEETFRLFAQMAEKGQVIYLTHHRHLCDIARSVCPSVKVHELPGPNAPAAETASSASV